MHLTNYAVNKKNTNFVRNEDPNEEDKGSKRSLSSVTKFLLLFSIPLFVNILFLLN
jgi:hypothetical protein